MHGGPIYNLVQKAGWKKSSPKRFNAALGVDLVICDDTRHDETPDLDRHVSWPRYDKCLVSGYIDARDWSVVTS